MILSDNETKLDLLNNEAIAKTIVSIIKNSKESVSIGVHGDWGAGKSSVLAMVENKLNPNNMVPIIADWNENDEEDWAESTESTHLSEFTMVRFNSWQYQGFEDAKVALMSAIVQQLENQAKAFYHDHKIKGGLKRIKEIGKRIWKNLDKLAVAKNAGMVGVSLATGTAPLAVGSIIAEDVKNTVTDQEKVSGVIGTVGNLLKVESETSGFKEMEEFRVNFKELFEEAHTKKLVVLIDDLDRCLPKVAIETLESVKMFLSLDNTAFIIAADDLMIRYAVREHFPRVFESDNQEDKNKGDYKNFSEKYLEKLIQVPFHIPRIGISEAQMYMVLLMIESKTGESEGLKNLVELVIKKLSKPWALEQLTSTEIKNALGDEYQSVTDEVAIALNTGKILAENTGGNPRNIKRFINMLLLRTEVAHNRGFDENELRMDVLAKMMLAEQYNNEFYKSLADELDENGKCAAFSIIAEEDVTDGKAEEIEDTEKQAGKAKAKKTKDKKVSAPPQVYKHESFTKYLEEAEVRKWIDINPSLNDVDLRPYYFACTEKEDYFFVSSEERIRELIVAVCNGKVSTARNKDKICALEESDARKLLVRASQAVFRGSYSDIKPPKVIEGIRRLVEFRTELQNDLADFLLTLPVDKVGMWATGEWDACIPKGCASRDKLDQFLEAIEKNGSNEMIRASAKAARE